jgi:prepilin-type N-terminal cleavage/methylation domain-containing protein
MNTIQHKNKILGFTLIEILMVVAIIAVIASVTVAVLNGARDGARNANRNEIARQYIIALGLHHNSFGTYPTGGCTAGGEACSNDAVWVCLGNQPTDNCFVFENHSENSTVNAQIQQFIPGLPAIVDPVVTVDGTFTGLAYGCIDGDCDSYSLSWVLEGEDAECYGGATKVEAAAASFCTFSTD